MASREEERIEPGGLDLAPAHGGLEGSGLRELVIEPLWLVMRAEFPEDDPVEKQTISRGRGPLFRREDDLVPSAREHVPRDRDLRDVEIMIGKRNEDTSGHDWAPQVWWATMMDAMQPFRFAFVSAP
jgi:hypothetical protein